MNHAIDRAALAAIWSETPSAGYGYDTLGALVSYRLGCDDVDGELDLTKLCVAND